LGRAIRPKEINAAPPNKRPWADAHQRGCSNQFQKFDDGGGSHRPCHPAGPDGSTPLTEVRAGGPPASRSRRSPRLQEENIAYAVGPPRAVPGCLRRADSRASSAVRHRGGPPTHRPREMVRPWARRAPPAAVGTRPRTNPHPPGDRGWARGHRRRTFHLRPNLAKMAATCWSAGFPNRPSGKFPAFVKLDGWCRCSLPVAPRKRSG